MKKLIWSILPIILIIVLWEMVSRHELVNVVLFPPPSKVFVALWSMFLEGTIFSDIGDSLWRVIIGFILGSVTGIIFGLLTGRIKFWNYALTPAINILRSFPPVAIIPFIIVWFGIDNPAKIFAIAFAVFFPVWINTYVGVLQIPQVFLWSARLFSLSFFKLFYKVVLPASLPFIIAGLRAAIGVAFVMVFVSELTGASSGLGYRISVTSLVYRMDEMMAALLVLGALGALFDLCFVFFANKLFPWVKFYSS